MTEGAASEWGEVLGAPVVVCGCRGEPATMEDVERLWQSLPLMFSGAAAPGSAPSVSMASSAIGPSILVPARASKRRKLGINAAVSAVAIIVLVTTCSIIALKIHRSGRSPFQSLIGKDYNNRRDNIKEILGNYGSLAPRRYKFSHLKKITKSFGEKLGEGSYGMVYKGTLPNGHHVAVKFLHDTTGNGEEFVNEAISIRRTAHVNVVTLLGFCLEGSKRALIYDYMPNGSLDKFIYTENSKQTLGWEMLYEIATGIARGLEYLHRGCNTRIIHFDIKPQNILLDQDFVPKIADFGLAKLCNPKESYLLSMDGMRGTVGFIAPEVFSRRFGVVSTKSDVYSFGMVLLEMVGGRRNLRASVEREVRCTSRIGFTITSHNLGACNHLTWDQMNLKRLQRRWPLSDCGAYKYHQHLARRSARF